jgi:frataxin
MTMSESAFHPLADEALEEIALAIETHLDDRIDVEQQEGVLTLDMEDGGQYLINKHAPNRQIWLSSPKSGAWHFACSGPGASWTSTRDAGTTLGTLLRQEIGAATGVYLDLTL